MNPQPLAQPAVPSTTRIVGSRTAAAPFMVALTCRPLRAAPASKYRSGTGARNTNPARFATRKSSPQHSAAGTAARCSAPRARWAPQRAALQEAQSPRVRRNVLWLFILCLIPFSAPIAAVVGLIWLQSNYEHVEKLPSLYAALAKIGVGVGLFQTAAILLLALVFTLLRS